MEIPLTYQSDGKKLRETRYCTICCTAAGVLDGSLPSTAEPALKAAHTRGLALALAAHTSSYNAQCINVQVRNRKTNFANKNTNTIANITFHKDLLGFVVCFGAQKAFAFTILYRYILVNALSAEPYASNRGDQVLYLHL